LPGAQQCVTASGGRTVLMRIESGGTHTDPNDPSYRWNPTVRGTCVTPEIAEKYPIGSHYAA
jgi:hypothetical protein